MDPAVYQLFGRACPFILAWLMGFAALTVATLAWRAWHRRSDVHRDSLIGGELPGLPLVLMHSACFAYACQRGDWASALLFGWWGPGFLVVATLVLAKRRVDWARIARATSIACKLDYLVLVGLFIHHHEWAPVFAYSLWIMHDQVRLAWLQHNADRTRRLCEDRWLPRICYPLFLAVPLIADDLPFRWACAGTALVVAVLWLWGLVRLRRMGVFMARPRSFTANLRDIVYLERTPTPAPAAG
jgi:hypothetical protein